MNLLLTALLCVSWCVAAEPEPVDQHQLRVRRLITDIRAFNIGSDSGEGLSTTETSENQVVASKLREALGLEMLSHSALGEAGKKLKAAQKAEFSKLLEQLFTKVIYPQAAKFLSKLELTYQDSESRGELCVVRVEVSHPDEGLIELEFFLKELNSRWIVQDLWLDGVSLRRDIEAQVQAILKKDGFSGLVARIRSKF